MAKRGVRVIDSNERVRRSQAVAAVIHSGRLEGFRDDSEWIQQMDRFARGEITRQELRAVAHQR